MNQNSNCPKTVPEILREGADIFEERHKMYGDNYKNFGKIMSGLFPDGISIESGDWDSLMRLGLVLNCVTKLARYTNNIQTGHQDSAIDLSVYAAMLREVTP